MCELKQAANSVVVQPPAAVPGDVAGPSPALSGQPTLWDRLAGAADPEWLFLLGCLLLPALLFCALGAWWKAEFFAGAAVYIAVMKWLGWAVVGRHARTAYPYLLFPAEFFVGLALTAVWFYLRNHLARLWPGSYSLRELSVIFWLLLPLHLLAALARVRTLRQTGLPSLAQLWQAASPRLSLYAPFLTCLTIALWEVSGILGVLGTDSIHYTYHARISLNEGLDFAVPPMHREIIYPSGLAGLNAVAAAVAPLNVVQAHHLQHVLVWVMGLLLITTTLATVVQRPLAMLHSAVLPFLVVFPMYSLYPDLLCSGAPKQLGPPLSAAVCLLPLAVPLTRPLHRYLIGGVVAVLTLLTAALNPACVPYAGVAIVVSLVVSWRMTSPEGQLPLGRLVMTYAVFLVAATALVVGADSWYRNKITAAAVRLSETSAVEQTASAAPPFFSTARAFRSLAGVHPFRLCRVEAFTVLKGFSWSDYFQNWPNHWPQQGLLWAALLLGILTTLILIGVRRRVGDRWVVPAWLALGCLVLYLGLKYGIGWLAGGVVIATNEALILSIYLPFLLLRYEVLLLFASVLGSCVVYQFVGQRRERSDAGSAWPLVWGFLSVLAATAVAVGVNFSGLVALPDNGRFPVTPEDLELIEWIDRNIPDTEGIALAAKTSEAGLDSQEKHIYPIGGGVGIALYSRRYNYRFLIPVLVGPQDWTAWTERINNRFDVVWCLENNIRYLYVPTKVTVRSPGIEEAIRNGCLRPLRLNASGGVYEILPPGEPPLPGAIEHARETE